MDRRTVVRHAFTGLAGVLSGALAAVLFAQAAPPAVARGQAEAEVRPVALRGAQPTAVEPAPLYVFDEPVSGYEVVSPFGPRRLPWEEHGRLHAGVDVAAPHGYPVQAAADGVVLRAGTDGGYGRFVELRHAGGLTTRYAHLGLIVGDIQPGLMLRRGDQIGLVGSSGSSTGAHLHFEIRDDRDRPLNPQMFLGRRFDGPDDLPLAEAARIPRRMRVAHVSYIPRRKRELMAAREAERAQGEAGLKRAQPDAGVRLTRAVFDLGRTGPPAPITLGPPAPTQVIRLAPPDPDAPIATAAGANPYLIVREAPGG